MMGKNVVVGGKRTVGLGLKQLQEGAIDAVALPVEVHEECHHVFIVESDSVIQIRFGFFRHIAINFSAKFAIRGITPHLSVTLR